MATLLDLATAPLVDGHDIADRFTQLEALLPPGDGVRWFCSVHEAMSKTVAHELGNGGFEDPALLERLDIHLVGHFLAALAADLQHGTKAVRKCWRPVFQRRADPDVQAIRFALAGINAHISCDLARAVVQTCEEAGIGVDRGTPLYRDYCRINELEAELRAGVKAEVYGPGLVTLDEELGPIDDHFETFGFWAAREAAWISGDVLDALPGPLADVHAASLDRTTGFVNSVLLLG